MRYGTTPLFHYVANDDIAKAIAQERYMIPQGVDYEGLPSKPLDARFCKPRVNFTTILPEEGRERIQASTGIASPHHIKYGLEIILAPEIEKRLVRSFEAFPDSLQIYSEEKVPVRVARIWNVDRAIARTSDSGEFRIMRDTTPTGMPFAMYERVH